MDKQKNRQNLIERGKIESSVFKLYFLHISIAGVATVIFGYI